MRERDVWPSRQIHSLSPPLFQVFTLISISPLVPLSFFPSLFYMCTSPLPPLPLLPSPSSPASHPAHLYPDNVLPGVRVDGGDGYVVDPVLQVSDPLPSHAGHKLNPGGTVECYHSHKLPYIPPSPLLPSPPFSFLSPFFLPFLPLSLPSLPPSLPPTLLSFPPPLLLSLHPTHAVRRG